jgi:molybdopterin-synthase adenylyltransferase
MLSPSERQRYERQLIMPEIAEAGQERLRRASVLIAGVGGLGSISAYYMTAAGVGRIRIVDQDRVELSNLNRQIIHRTGDIGEWKTVSAEEKLQQLNPDCRIEAKRATLTKDNVLDLARGCDLILDATDNLAARRALNFASLTLGIPFIYGGIHGFEGMVSFFYPKKTACFECIFASGPDHPAAPIGVLGATAGMVASVQCLEAIKYLVGLESALMNRLLRIDARKMAFKRIQLDRNKACKICSQEEN